MNLRVMIASLAATCLIGCAVVCASCSSKKCKNSDTIATRVYLSGGGVMTMVEEVVEHYTATHMYCTAPDPDPLGTSGLTSDVIEYLDPDSVTADCWSHNTGQTGVHHCTDFTGGDPVTHTGVPLLKCNAM